METKEKSANRIMTAMVVMGSVIGIWAFSSVLIGLSQANWQMTEMLRQYLVAIGGIKEYETLVDFYTHIKGIEYIICVAFLGAFPAFYKYVNTSKTPSPIDS
jgi:hypothetical protein